MTKSDRDLHAFPIHLGLGATATRLPEFDGTMAWYQRYGESHAADGIEGRLVSLHTFTEPWDSWEMHPNGEEVVACVAGELTLHQEIDGKTVTVTLAAGEAVVNPAGVWHTADIDGEATGVFITPGIGTEIRPR